MDTDTSRPGEPPHPHRRIVITGGPGAGKTAVLELVRHSFCSHVRVLPEAASILFGGGFPRLAIPAGRQAAQRAIFHVQRELEAAADATDGAAILLCDRGTVDGAAYWDGASDFWSSVGTTWQAELERYAVVIHLRVPPSGAYNHRNPLRHESLAEAQAIDQRLVAAWDGHPRRFFVDNTHNFLDKARATLALLRDELPSGCVA